MPKIIALAALALLLPLGAAPGAQAEDAQEFESRRLRDDMRQREQVRERRKEQRFQAEQEAKKEERLHRQRMEEKREGNRHQRGMKRAEAAAARAAEADAKTEAELEAALSSSDPDEPSAEAEALQEIEEIIEEVAEEASAEDPLLLFALDGEPSRRQSYEWVQGLPETGTFLFQWTYTYGGKDYTASTELDIGFIPESTNAYLPLAQHTSSSERDSIRNYGVEREVIQIYGSRLVYVAFLNRTGLNFRFNPSASRAAGYSRFRDIRITRMEQKPQEEGE